MNNKIKSFIKYILPIIILLIILIALIVAPYFVENKPFIIGADIRTQHRLFFEEFKLLMGNFVKVGSPPFWSWNLFFGNNFWASKSYYILSDIFAYFSLVFDNHYYYLLILQTTLKLSLSVFTFLLYCRIRKFDYFTSIVTSFCWGFSAWALNFTNQPIFLYFYSLLPLYFASIELFFQNRKKYLYAIIVSIMLITNYYLFFTLSIFTIVYYLYRYNELYGTMKHFFKNATTMILYYLVGVLCTSFIIFPSFLYIIDNNRVGAFSLNNIYWDDIRTYFQVLISPFFPTNIYVNKIISIEGVSKFSSIFNTVKYSTREILLWSGSLTYMLVLNGLFDKDKLHRKLNRYYVLFIILLAMFPFLSSIIHGFSEASFRWTMFAIFINLMISCRYLQNMNLINNRVVFHSSVMGVSILLLTLPLTSYVLGVDFSEHLDQYLKIVIMIPILLTIAFTVIKRKKALIFVLVFLELGYSNYMTFNDNPSFKEYDWDFIYRAEHVLGYQKDLTNYIDNYLVDNDFYRIFAPYEQIYWYYSLNMNLIYDFQGVNTYDSTYNYSQNDLLLLYDIYNPTSWTWEINQGDILNFVSVKYAFAVHENELPSDGFVKIEDFYGINMYENLNYRSVANTYDELITYNEYKEYNDISLINNKIICHDYDYLDISEYLTNTSSYEAFNINKYQNGIDFSIKSDEKTFVVTSIPFDKGWNVIVDNEHTTIYKVNGGFVGFGIENQGIHSISMSFMPSGFKEGLLMTVSGLIILVGLIVFERSQK